MKLKDVKIKINEIPVEWTDRSRSGHTNIWNYRSEDQNKPEVELNPPQRGLYAERFEDGWYWVCGCDKCLGIKGKWSYIVCDDHDRCNTCGTHRKDLTETPWGHPDGFECKPCRSREKEEKKQAALLNAKANGYDEWDHYREDNIVCPVCFSKNSDEDYYEPGDHEVECSVCDTRFIVEVEFDPKYTSRLIEDDEEEG